MCKMRGPAREACPMIVTIDGPAGTGKSSVSRAVAERLDFDFLDTGAMYRAIGLEAVRREADLDDQREMVFIAQHCRIEFDWAQNPPGVLLNGELVTHLLRGGEATRAASRVATIPAIRERLVEQQRQIWRGHGRRGLVTEGRDQGSVVFPTAAFKFYLDADPAERARRRVRQLRERGETVDERAILDEMIERDRRDTSRAVAPLIKPRDATHIDTSSLTQEDVIERIVAIVRGGEGR